MAHFFLLLVLILNLSLSNLSSLNSLQSLLSLGSPFNYYVGDNGPSKTNQNTARDEVLTYPISFIICGSRMSKTIFLKHHHKRNVAIHHFFFFLWLVVLATFKNLPAERALSKCSQSLYIADIVLKYIFFSVLIYCLLTLSRTDFGSKKLSAVMLSV